MTENEKIEIAISCATRECCEGCPAYENEADCKEVATTAISALKEIRQYREIGTVKECREAVEKQKRKKPKEILRRRGGFENHHCPNCGTEYQIDGRYTITDKYCPVCGKLLDSAFGSYCGNCGQRIVKESEKNLMEKRWSDERD
ncbi:MAG: hypothetical protein KHZ73_00690 [Lachnospiraceae bacterium]|nr:hypothetical protein [Lachnospiraceae bacterium]